AKRLFRIFYECLKKIDEVLIEGQATKIKLTFGKQTFSIIGYAGKTGRKSHLVINSNINEVISLEGKYDDRIRSDGTKKGSLGIERYEVFITTEEDLMNFLSIIETDFYKNNQSLARK
ncbi:MAG: hypothetical protein Q7S39_09570, partial [Ignavibacteria bacterium]|nr:hypothetical protein [Ignavibacteria bacterium]